MEAAVVVARATSTGGATVRWFNQKKRILEQWQREHGNNNNSHNDIDIDNDDDNKSDNDIVIDSDY